MKDTISGKLFLFCFFGAGRHLAKIILSCEASILIITTGLGSNLVFSRKPTILSSRRGIGHVWSGLPLYSCSPVFASSQDVPLNGKFFLGHPINAFSPHFYPRLLHLGSRTQGRPSLPQQSDEILGTEEEPDWDSRTFSLHIVSI